jgi:hypothetical protein
MLLIFRQNAYAMKMWEALTELSVVWARLVLYFGIPPLAY